MKYSTKHFLSILVFTLLYITACQESLDIADDGGADADSDMDTDTDTDADSDEDTDSNEETDPETDTTSDSDALIESIINVRPLTEINTGSVDAYPFLLKTETTKAKMPV